MALATARRSLKVLLSSKAARVIFELFLEDLRRVAKADPFAGTLAAAWRRALDRMPAGTRELDVRRILDDLLASAADLDKALRALRKAFSKTPLGARLTDADLLELVLAAQRLGEARQAGRPAPLGNLAGLARELAIRHMDETQTLLFTIRKYHRDRLGKLAQYFDEPVLVRELQSPVLPSWTQEGALGDYFMIAFRREGSDPPAGLWSSVLGVDTPAKLIIYVDIESKSMRNLNEVVEQFAKNMSRIASEGLTIVKGDKVLKLTPNDIFFDWRTPGEGGPPSFVSVAPRLLSEKRKAVAASLAVEPEEWLHPFSDQVLAEPLSVLARMFGLNQ